jgi:hypothetical protein
MHFHPANAVEDPLGVCSFLHPELLVQLILGEVGELSVVSHFFDKVIHRSDIPPQHFINTAVSFGLKCEMNAVRIR